MTLIILMFPPFINLSGSNVILIDASYWKGLIEWIKQTLIKEKSISKSDLALFNIVDTPEEAIGIIKKTLIV